MSIVEKLKEATIPSLYSSGAAIGLYYLLIDNDLSQDLPFLSMSVPTWAAVAGATFVGSELGSLATEFIAPKIPILNEYETIEKMVVPSVMGGLGTVLAIKGLISDQVDIKNAFIVGAGANLIAQNVYSKI